MNLPETIAKTLQSTMIPSELRQESLGLCILELNDPLLTLIHEAAASRMCDGWSRKVKSAPKSASVPCRQVKSSGENGRL